MGKTIATNKKAFRDYVLTDTFECGIALAGAEVKSIRNGKVNFKDSFARIDKDEVYLHNLHIDQYAQASYLNHESTRTRKLLLHKREIQKIAAKAAQQNLTIVPTKIYFNNRGYVKLELALGKGRKAYDKREMIKKRKIDRDISRHLKHNKR